MGITRPSFTPAQESLFLTLGGRALDSRLPRPDLGDTLPDEILTRVDYDLATFPALTTTLLVGCASGLMPASRLTHRRLRRLVSA